MKVVKQFGQLYLLGAGGFSREVRGLLSQNHDHFQGHTYADKDLIYLDDGIDEIGNIESIPVGADYVCTIADPETRRRIVRMISREKASPITITHPSLVWQTYGEPHCTIGDGCIIMEQCLLKDGVIIGDHVHLNTGTHIGHDAIVEDFVTTSGRVHINGGAHIKSGAFLTTGCIILPGVTIGEGCVVGPGCRVYKDMLPGTRCLDRPAEPSITPKLTEPTRK